MLIAGIDIFATIAELFMLFVLFYKPKINIWKCLFFSGLLYLLAIRCITILGIQQSTKLIIFLCSNSLIGYIVFRNPFVKSIILGFLQLISVYFGELFVQSVLLILYQPGLANLSSLPTLYVGIILLAKVIGIGCCFIFRHIFGNLEYPYNWELAFCLLFPLGMILWSMAKLQELIFNTRASSHIYKEALLSIGLLIAIVCLLFTYQYYFRIKELQLKCNISEAQMLSTFQFYEDRLQQESNNRRIYHDIQAHITTLQNMQPSEERNDYGQELLQLLHDMNFPYHTGVETIDVVLNEKQIFCKKHGIRLVCVGDFVPLHVLKPMELVTIFHNAIENAIAEYSTYDYPEQLIEIQTWTFHNFIHLRFMNHYQHHEPENKDTNTDLHGFGIKNMKYVISRYNGEVIPVIEDGCFYLRIIIPLIPEEHCNV